MIRQGFADRPRARACVAWSIAILSAGQVFFTGRLEAGQPRRPDSPVARGRALFLRVWTPDDPRARGGDGLGPVFNERSCVACHNLGGVGGAGSRSKNVDILTITKNAPTAQGRDVDKARSESASALPPADDIEAMAMIHSGFAASQSLVLHRFGTAPNYEAWRQNVMVSDPPDRNSHAASRDDASEGNRELPESAKRGAFSLKRSQRNSTSLFGAGLIDSIPDEAIDVPPRSPGIKGRPNRLKDGRIGKFGWKAQMASLDEFVTTACSVELGLEVPGHHQAGDPLGCEREAKQFDMTRQDCDDMVAFVRSLPTPIVRTPANALGRKLFETIGCAACHVPKLGEVEGIYSDLMLHDLGERLQDTGGYGTFTPSRPSREDPLGSSLVRDEPKTEGAARTQPRTSAGELEWRTPPLWGVRDSAPYMHDGRAATLEAAIDLHGAEGHEAAERFRLLSNTQQGQLIRFLQSLAAPRKAMSLASSR